MGTPSGFQGGFTGSLDGMGYTISDLTIERSGESYVGLFGCLTESARVTNLTLSGSISGQSSVGGIAGKNLGLIRNVANKAAVKGNSSVGVSPALIMVRWNLSVTAAVSRQQMAVVLAALPAVMVTGTKLVL